MTRRSWIKLVVGGVAVAAVAGLLVVGLGASGSGGSASGSSSPAVRTTTAKVVRSDLVAQQQVNGTLGYAGSYTVVNLYKPATSTSTGATAGATGSGGSSGGAAAGSSSGSGGAATGSGSGTVTALPSAGATIVSGQPVYSIDTRPIPLLYGALPAYRAFTSGMSDGPDVAQLEDSLVKLGYASTSDLTIDNHFDSSTATAITSWQGALGLPTTGSLQLGEVVFLPGPVRVTNLNVAVGAPVGVGTNVLTGTSMNRIVTVALDASQQYLVKAGDPVTVALPDGKTTANGSVFQVSTVATSSSNSTSNAPAGQATQGQNSAPTATIPVTIVLADPAAAGALDQAPVTVNITSQSAKGVLAVPVNALLALASGGYGVDIAGAGGVVKLVPVQTGLFANTLVEVRGAGVAEGQRVQVPAP